MRQPYHTYLIKVQYLGFRYSGWQVQPNQRTIEGMLVKTLKFILQEENFKILGAGRTDAKVSANSTAFELFLEHELKDSDVFLSLFNKNLPPDIRILSIIPVSDKFNIIKDVKIKEYNYLFSFGEKNHPFCAPFMANIQDNLNIDAMKTASKIFEGTHDFSAYTVKESKVTSVKRTIKSCKIKPNTILSANFFPENSYLLQVIGAGFIRYQIRMMMGALIQLGKGQLRLRDIENSLTENNTVQLTYIAPGSGLHLHRLEFKNFDTASENYMPIHR